MPYHEACAVSFGGPDNWGAALVIHALMAGLAGARDLETAYRSVEVSPRWMAAGVDEVTATARYRASPGYVSYRFKHDVTRRSISVLATGSAERGRMRILLPRGAGSVSQLLVDGAAHPFQLEHVRESLYATLAVALIKPVSIEVRY
jgi:hypothetical protein